MNVKSKSYLYQHGTLGGLMEDLMDGTGTNRQDVSLW